MPDITDGLTELAFLQQKAAAGKLIIVQGTSTSTGSVASYVPAAGTTFVIYRAKFSCSTDATNAVIAQLRNNATVLEQARAAMSTAVGLNTYEYEFIIKGDQLIGDGVKKYDINISANTSGLTVNATIIGYLL